MLRTFRTMGAFAALATYAAADDKGGAPDPINKSDAAPAPQTADEKAPAAAQATPGAVAAVGNAPGADPSPPTNAKDANKIGKKVAIVWAQPGHEVFGIGMMLRVPGEVAEAVRGAGRARYASDAEVKAAKEAKLDVPDLDSI